MKTLKADSRQRVRLPAARPGQVFSYTADAAGLHLIPLPEPKPEEPKPDSVRIVRRKGGHSVAVGGRPITSAEIRQLLNDLFP